jgi:hypothetical protein
MRLEAAYKTRNKQINKQTNKPQRRPGIKGKHIRDKSII